MNNDETSNLLLDERPLILLPGLARLLGLNEAIILQQIHYWIKKNSENGKQDRHYREGRFWTYNTHEEWQKCFDWWSISTIRRTLDSLIKKGVLIAKPLEQQARDMTLWYTIDYVALRNLSDGSAQNEQVQVSNKSERKRSKRVHDSSETSPEITHTESPPLNVSDTRPTSNDNALANMRHKAVQEIVGLTGDSSSWRRFQQLFGIAEEHGRLDDWAACIHTLRRRLTITEAPLERPGAYFCKMLADRLLEHGVSVPVGSKAEREEVRRLVRESLGNE